MKKLILFLTLLFVGLGSTFEANAQYLPSNNLNYIKLLKTPPIGSVEDSVMVYDSSSSFVKMLPKSSIVAGKENTFSKNTAFNKNFGTTAGTVAEGNDSRLSDARTPLSHTLDSHSNVTITTNSNGEILKWNGTAWVNNTLVEAGIQPAGTYATGGGSATGTNTGDNAVNSLYSGLVTNATHTGDITGSTALTIANGAVTLAKMDNVATGTVFYRKTASTGVPEVQTLATLKTDLAITKTDVGLGNVDDTSDANKPISTAAQTALDSKAPISNSTNYIQNQNASAQSANMWISGSIRNSQLTLRSDTLEEFSSDSDNGVVAVNFNGYNGGTSRFRDFRVFNGKQASLLHIIGSTGAATFTSTVTASPATLDTQLATLGQVNGIADYKAPIASPVLTGIPTAPTAPVGTNTTQIATTAFVQAFDTNVVHNTGAESVGGVKTFTSTPKFSTAAISINNSDNDGYGSILLNVNRFIFKDKTNAAQFLTQSAGFASYKSPSIIANFINTSLTATRSYSLPDISGTLALINDTALSGTPTAPTAPAGTNTDQIATTAFVQANSSARPYKVYTALISQGGTSAPTATVLENTLGGTVVWSRNSVGVYAGTLGNGFSLTLSKVRIFISGGEPHLNTTGFYNALPNSIDSVHVNTRNTSGSLADNLMTSGATIEIRVYN